MNSPPIRFVGAEELRRLFNDGGYWDRAQRGEIEQQIISESHPAPLRANLPECTKSQIVAYYSHGEKVAIVHQYFRPDGSLGASGRPDPKRLLLDGILYAVP